MGGIDVLEVPARGKASGDVSRATLVRFVRAEEGPPSYDTPDLDDTGSTLSTGDLRLVRGPMVGMTLGGRSIRVGVVRDLLPSKIKLFVTTRGSSALKVSWLNPSETLSPPGVQLLKLRSEVASGSANDKHVSAELENEHLLAKHIVPALGVLTDYREKAATKAMKELGLTSYNPFESNWAALERALKESPHEPKYAEVRWEMSRRWAAIQSLRDTLEHVDEATSIEEIAKSTKVLDARKKAVTGADARRAGSAAATQAEAVVELRVGSAKGTIVAELGVVMFPLIEIEIMPHVVSLGARPIAEDVYDTLDQDFGVPTDFSKGTFTYVDVAALVARANVILAPVGVRCFVRPGTAKRYRLYDAIVPSGTNIPDLDKWNKRIPGFDNIFNPAGRLVVGSNLDARAEPWANLLMNAHAGHPDTEHRLNLYFVSTILAGGEKAQAVAFNDETQTQSGATVSFAGLPIPKTTPTPFTLTFGPDQLGICVAVRELTGFADRAFGWTTMGRALAHEIGHMGTLPHYLGGEQSGVPTKALEDIWAARNLMHYSARVLNSPPGATAARATGYGSHGGSPLAGALLTLKNYKAPKYKATAAAAPAPTPGVSQISDRNVPYTPKPTQQASVMRRYFNGFTTAR